MKPTFLFALSVVGLASSAVPALANMASVSGSAPRAQWVERGGGAPELAFARMIGPMPAGRTLSFNIALAYPNPAAVHRFVEAVNDPSSPAYGHFLTPAQFTAAFEPSAATYAALERELVANGVRIAREWPNRKLLGVTASAGTIERYFKTTLVQYANETGVHYANATPPLVPARLAGIVLAVSGLNDTVYAAPLPDRLGERSVVSTIPMGYFTSQIQSVYDEPIHENAAYNGAGVTIAIEAFGKYQTSDIKAFYAEMGISRALPKVNVNDGEIGLPVRTQEATLDADWSSGNAPGANVIVYEGPNFTNQVAEDVYATVVDNPKVDVTSTSWGGCEALFHSDFISTSDDFFQQGSAEGITQFAPAGDNGSNDCRGNFGTRPPKNYPNPSVDFPASDPEMGAAGGTQLTIGANGKRQTEIGWPIGVPSAIWGGGGGASGYFATPSYQAGIVALANAGTIALASTSYRNTPDVALMGSPDPEGYNFCYNGCGGGGYGTSFVGPNMAAIYAQIDSYTQHRMGRAATGLYYWSLRKTPTFPAAVYYDVTSGSNGLYTAAVNYDNVTGFGSFKSANQYMLKLPIPSGAPNL